MSDEISNSEDIIDSREVIERIKDLEDVAADGDLEEWEEDELAQLRDLAAEGESLGDWAYGVALIRDSYFTQFAQQEAEDLGLIDDSARWPATCIDWEEAASELQADYTSINFNGETYWARA